MKLRLLVVVVALAAVGQSIAACVGDDPAAGPPGSSDGGQPEAGGDSGGPPDGANGDTGVASDAGDAGDGGDAADAADADDGAPKCPTSIPTLPSGPHCPDNPNGTDLCPAASYCCSTSVDRKCNGSGFVCVDKSTAIPHWTCEADTKCTTGQVCAASITPRADAGCPLEFDIPLDQGAANCYNSGSQPNGSKILCDPNGGAPCIPGTCRPAIMHFPNTTKTFVIGVCSP